MEIITGINPNCSELVIRLGTTDEDLVRSELQKIGIREVLAKNIYKFESEPKEWDNNSNEPDKGIIPVSELNPEVIELWKRMRKDDLSEEEYKDIRDKLKDKYNIDYLQDTLVLEDKENNMPDLEHCATVTIGKDRDYSDDLDNVAIWGHQHCQWQIFPTLKKIADHFGAVVEPYDGGSIDPFESFLEGMTWEEYNEEEENG